MCCRFGAVEAGRQPVVLVLCLVRIHQRSGIVFSSRNLENTGGLVVILLYSLLMRMVMMNQFGRYLWNFRIIRVRILFRKSLLTKNLPGG